MDLDRSPTKPFPSMPNLSHIEFIEGDEVVPSFIYHPSSLQEHLQTQSLYQAEPLRPYRLLVRDLWLVPSPPFTPRILASSPILNFTNGISHPEQIADALLVGLKVKLAKFNETITELGFDEAGIRSQLVEFGREFVGIPDLTIHHLLRGLLVAVLPDKESHKVQFWIRQLSVDPAFLPYS